LLILPYYRLQRAKDDNGVVVEINVIKFNVDEFIKTHTAIR